MHFLKSPLLGNVRYHDRVGGPTVAGMSLVPVAPHAFSAFRAIGGRCDAVASDAVEAHCSAIVGEAREAMRALGSRLAAHLHTAKGYLAEAERLARMPVAGDEVEVIRGMVAAVTAALGEPDADTRNAGHLASVLKHSAGFNVGPLVASLADLRGEAAATSTLRAELAAVKVALVALIDLAEDPANVEAARAKKISGKLARVVPPTIVELRTLQSEVGVIAQRVAALLQKFEAVA